mmetsp:Transcript_53622/g.160066  ORF Transcript_53622/g.160066 Transcript_53622/m.160066 type:complete len:300 (-) Transcript_53622:63-962(-)
MWAWLMGAAASSECHQLAGATGSQQQPGRVRHSSTYDPEDDDYDPAKPEYLQPATAEEMEDMDLALLDRQIRHLQVFLARRSGLDPRIALHYADVLDGMYGERLQFERETSAAKGCEDSVELEYAGNPTILESGFRSRTRSCSAWDLELDRSCKLEPSDLSPWLDKGTEAANGELIERKATSSTAASDRDWERPEERLPAGRPCNPWLAREVDTATCTEEPSCNRCLAKAILERIHDEMGSSLPVVLDCARASMGAKPLLTGEEEVRCSSPSKKVALNSQVGCCGLWEVFRILVSPPGC